MSNAVMKVSLPETLKKEAETLAQEGQFSTTSSYIQHLIRREVERRQEIRQLEAIVEKSLASGISEKQPEAFLAELKALISRKPVI